MSDQIVAILCDGAAKGDDPVGGERKFLTQKDGLLALKSASVLPESIPIAMGWTTIFEKLTGKSIKELAQANA